MKITMLTLLFALLFTTGMAQCDIGTTGIAVRNATNTASVSSGCVGQIFNFRFTVANFGSSPSCVMPAGTVKVTFDFPTISGGIKPYIYHGPASFNTGFFTWFYDSFFEQLKGVNTTAIGFGQGDADILVEVIGNAAGTASSPLNLFPGPNTNNTNNDFASAQLIINALPTVTWANTLANQCANSTSYTLTGGSPAGGTYSGTGVTGNNFNAVTAGPGTYTLTYSFTNAGGCTASATNTITVFALPVVAAGSYGPVCSNAAPVTLTGAPAGGTWSGTGVTGNSFNPSVGTQTLTYTYTDKSGCTNSSTTTITVNTAPVVTAGSYGPVCSNASPVALVGSPSGGTWSGTGVTGNSFNPAVGTQTLTYTFSNGTCSNSSTTTITVNTAPVVTAGSYGPVCSNASPVALVGSPSGGTWSGTGVTGNSFNPAVGTQTLTYTFSNGTCSNSSTTTITVNTAPVVTAGSYGPVCSNASPVALVGSPSGGTWSGTGVTGNSFNPAAGTQTLTYTFSNGTCSNSSTTTITVNTAPVVTAGSYGPVCSNASTVALAGSPSGGTWSGTGVTGNSFNPAAGTQTLTYTFSNGTCSNSSTTTITVNTAPVVTAGSYGPVCSNASPVALVGSPSGGTWSGTGVTGNNFNPSAGTQTLTYTYSDGNSCSNSSTTTITVNTAPVVTAGSYGPVCSNASPVALVGSPSGGTWSGTGVTGNSFNPAVGTQTLTYTFSNGTCSNSSTTTITVNPAPVVTTGSYGPVCSNTGLVSLTGTPSGGTWSGTGVTGNNFDPSAGTQTITYTFNNGTCSNSAATTITVNPAPVVTTGSYGPICSNAGLVSLTGTPSGGTWSGTGVTGNSFDPSAGTQTITYTFSNGTCSNSAATTIVVNAAPVVGFTGLAANYCTTDAAVTLTGTPSGGTFSGPGISGNTFNPGTAGAGVFTIVYSFTNGSGCTSTASQQVTVTVCATFATLDLKVFLEGFYTGGSTMRTTLFDLGMSADPTATDMITVNLWSPSNLLNPTPDYTITTLLHSDGTATMQFPAGVTNNSWYIAVKHRNSMETWSKNPVPFTTSASYDFSNSLLKAYDDTFNPPMASVGGGVFAIYGGDVNQDGGIEASDMAAIDNDPFAFGYNDTDVTGDGGTDASDMAIVDNNGALFLFMARPY